MEKTIVLTIGASCSGKTTWAEDFRRNRSDVANLNRDDYRFNMFTGGVRDWSLYKFTKSHENLVSRTIDAAAAVLASEGKNIIISDTNLNPKIRQKWVDFADKHGYTKEFKCFHESWDELVKRNTQREGGIGLPILRKQYLNIQEFLNRRTYQPDVSLPKAVIVDVDGTVADMNGRGPFEWNKVDTDLPRATIIAMVCGLYAQGYKIIFLSGRDGSCYDLTHKWLKDCVGLPFELHMRGAGDHRKDFTIKEELFWPLAERFNIVSAIDDRPQVLRLWEELKIPNVINVNKKGLYGEF